MCHQYYSSLSKREVTEVFQVSIDKPRNTENRGKKTIVITLNKVCKDWLGGRLRRELPSLGIIALLPISERLGVVLYKPN